MNVMPGTVLIWLLAIAAAAVIAGSTAYAFFRKPFSPSQWLLYYINWLVVRVLWRVELPERLPLPPNQGAVIIYRQILKCHHCIVRLK